MIIKIPAEFCEKDSVINPIDGERYDFERTTAYTDAYVGCKNGGVVSRFCGDGGKWSNVVIDYCRTAMTDQLEDLELLTRVSSICHTHFYRPMPFCAEGTKRYCKG